MDRATVKQLAETRDDPAVSILCPLDSLRPGNAEDPVVLADLRDQAIAAVTRAAPRDVANAVIARIHVATSSVDFAHPSPGVAIFVSADSSRVVGLDAAIRPQVVVGDRFAIRDLVTEMLRTRRARIIVLSLTKTRCVDLTGTVVTERHDSGFPVQVVPPTEADTPHRDFPLSEREGAEAARFVFRAVDRVLGPLQRRSLRPLVIVGAERDISYFDETTGQDAHIVGRVHGNHERDTPEQLARLVQPALAEHERREQGRVCSEIREAIGTHAVSGIGAVWEAASTGRGHRLVVEEGYCDLMRTVDGALAAAAADEPEAFDAVERCIEEVVRHNGDVIVVAAGSLHDLDRIALFTRY